MTSYAASRDPMADHLLTPQNAAVLIIDFQPVQVNSIASRDKRQLVANITAISPRSPASRSSTASRSCWRR